MAKQGSGSAHEEKRKDVRDYSRTQSGQEIRPNDKEYNVWSEQGMNKVTGFIEHLKLVLKATVKEVFQTAFEQCTASHEGFHSTH